MKLLPCKCKNDSQDEMYGHGKRLFNRGKRGNVGYEYHCTVCGQKVTIPMIIEINTRTGKVRDVREVY